MVKGIKMRLFETLENPRSSKPRGAKLVAEPAADGVAQRTPPLEKRSRPLGRRRQRVLPRRGQLVVPQLFLARTVPPLFFFGKIDSASGEVALQVLPEVCELECRADVVGPFVKPPVFVAGNPQHEPATGFADRRQ